jgi:anti-sigma B factor antagonist
MAEEASVQATVSSHTAGGVTNLAVTGEVDLTVGPLLERAINSAVAADGVTAVQVDLSAVQFLDSSGIGLLVRGRRMADARGVGYQVRGARGMVRQVLEMTGVWAHLSGDNRSAAT